MQLFLLLILWTKQEILRKRQFHSTLNASKRKTSLSTEVFSFYDFLVIILFIIPYEPFII